MSQPWKIEHKFKLKFPWSLKKFHFLRPFTKNAKYCCFDLSQHHSYCNTCPCITKKYQDWIYRIKCPWFIIYHFSLSFCYIKKKNSNFWIPVYYSKIHTEYSKILWQSNPPPLFLFTYAPQNIKYTEIISAIVGRRNFLNGKKWRMQIKKVFHFLCIHKFVWYVQKVQFADWNTGIPLIKI